MFPRGFFTNGIHCGIKKNKEKKDLAIFYSKDKCVSAGMFTSNLVKAAPVKVSQKHLKTGKFVHAIIANSGCANACAGVQGMKDAEEMCLLAANALKVKKEEVLCASTGVIGSCLPMPEIRRGINQIVEQVSSGVSNENYAVESIMTTDTFAKVSTKTIEICGKEVNIWGCVKGAGMIHPDLKAFHATMLGFILTDVLIDKKMLKNTLELAVKDSFNCVSVDGDTSTNDTLVILANGAAENIKINKNNDVFTKFSKAVSEVCLDLAKMIAKDGEGATHLIEIEVKNAVNEKTAKKIASVVATSPLVKTAIFGLDANWGRIIAAVGRSGVKIDPDKIDIYIGGIMVTHEGSAADYSEQKVKKELEKKEIKIVIDINSGKYLARYYTCDFSFDYVKINADYRS